MPKRHSHKKHDQDVFDAHNMMDDYDDVMKELVTRGGAAPRLHCHNHNHARGDVVLWPEDKVLYMRELNRYRKLYVEMTELLRAAKKTFSKRAKGFAHKEKYFQKKIETKEKNFAQVVDGLQSTFQALKGSLNQAHQQINTLMQQRDEAKAESKRLQAEVFMSQDENNKNTGTLGELERRNQELDGDRRKLVQENEQLKQQLLMTNAELSKETSQSQWNVARIRELENAVEEIWSAQNSRANMDHESLNQFYEDLRNTSKELHLTQQQLANVSAALTHREAEVEKQRKTIELHVREISSQKQTIATLNQLIQRLSNKHRLDDE